jgi:hypothetical protein
VWFSPCGDSSPRDIAIRLMSRPPANRRENTALAAFQHAASAGCHPPAGPRRWFYNLFAVCVTQPVESNVLLAS